MKILMIGLSLVMLGCASAPMTYEQRVALAAVGAGLQNAGAQMRSRDYYQPMYVPPVQVPQVQPMQIPASQPWVPIPSSF